MKFADTGGELRVVVDHTESLLTEARDRQAADDLELACLFYATWVEHLVNKMVVAFLARRGLSKKEAVLILRQASLEAKISWILRLVEAPPIVKHHREAIGKISEIRNAFIHYKWVAPSENKDKAEKEHRKSILGSFEKTVRYLKNYYHRNVLQSGKNKIRRIVR